jgi:hypothetical protein
MRSAVIAAPSIEDRRQRRARCRRCCEAALERLGDELAVARRERFGIGLEAPRALKIALAS